MSNQYPKRQKPASDRDAGSLHNLQVASMIADQLPSKYVSQVIRIFDAHDIFYEKLEEVKGAFARFESALDEVEGAIEDRTPIPASQITDVLESIKTLEGLDFPAVLAQLEDAYKAEAESEVQ